MLGIHEPRAGEKMPDKANTLATCWKKMNEKAITNPMKTWTPTPRRVFRAATLKPSIAMMSAPTGFDIRLCFSISYTFTKLDPFSFSDLINRRNSL